MSTVYDEAELGRTQSSGDDESETERQNGDIESEAGEGPPIPILNEPDEGEDDRDSLRNTGVSFRRYAGERPNTQESSTLGFSQNSERPQSPNGSLSIPDDTPSIQVTNLLSFCRAGILIYTGI